MEIIRSRGRAFGPYYLEVSYLVAYRTKFLLNQAALCALAADLPQFLDKL